MIDFYQELLLIEVAIRARQSERDCQDTDRVETAAMQATECEGRSFDEASRRGKPFKGLWQWVNL